MKESNDLRHSISIDNNKANCIIKIRLNDECKNGHQDFSVTATFWEIGKTRNDRNMICGGCCHEEILKIRPDLKQFTDLHLCDFNGVPMYAEANGFYHLIKGFERLNGKSQKEYFCDCYRISPKQYDILITTKEESHFAYLLHNLGIIKQWGKEAIKAIKELEKLTGIKFVNDSKRTHLKYTEEQIKEIANDVKNGYYTEAKQIERINKKVLDLKAKKIQDSKDSFDKKQKELLIQFKLDLIGIELFGTTDNIIYYTHINEVVFNWQNSSYVKKYTNEEFDEFVKNAKQNDLLKDIDFIIKQLN